jgi:catechol 2,3-dioxygenase-like lactoylglutathione lyase family enzyme
MAPIVAKVTYFEHVGLTVPNLDAAVDFFVAVFGAEELYRSSRGGDSAFMTRNFEILGDTSFALAMLRLPPNLNIELFEWSASDTRSAMPRASDLGGHHLCLAVTDVFEACDALRTVPDVRILGDVKTVDPGSPMAGTRWTYFVTPWGLRMELVDRSKVVDPPSLARPTD